LSLMLGACARMGQPEGGKKDTVPPKVVAATPPSGTVNFHGDKIIIRFDELIQLDNPLQKVVFSPPLSKKTVIKPTGYPDRKIEIRFKEPLRPNTTYTVFFGDAIKDFHEGNVLQNYSYVFSTGPQLDSLRLSGKVVSLPEGKLPDNVIVGLYPVKNFSDSLIYRRPPYYLTKAGMQGRFELRNLAAGDYYLIAFADENKNLTYQPGDERIAFLPKPVHLPSDSAHTLYLFAEPKRFNLKDIQARSARHWVASFEGDTRGIHPAVPGKTLKDYISGDNQWHLWIKPVSKGEKTEFLFLRQGDTLARLRRQIAEQPVDTFVVKWDKNELYPIDSLRLLTNMPLTRLTSSDGIRITPRHPKDRWRIDRQGLWIFYPAPATEREKIVLEIMPGTLENFAGLTNPDTLRQTVRLRPVTETGNYTLIWKDRPAGTIVAELTGPKGEKTVRRQVKERDSVFVFRYLPPGKYRLRFIIDLNGNGRWDEGSWRERRLPEPVVFYNKPIEIRARWDLEETFISRNKKSAGALPAKGFKGMH